MKLIRSACLYILLTAILLHGLVQPAAAQENMSDPAVINGCHSIDAAKPLETQAQILETAKAAVVYERTSGTMIYNFNADSRIYPASMVKLVTARFPSTASSCAPSIMPSTSHRPRVTAYHGLSMRQVVDIVSSVTRMALRRVATLCLSTRRYTAWRGTT